jgi:hypothetical protein
VDTSRAARVGANQDLFRQVNKKVAKFGEGEVEFMELICECSDVGCHERISMSSEEFIDVRRDPTHFAVHSNHVNKEFEHVVARTDRYVVVEKVGEAADVAVTLEEGSTTS